MIVYDLTLFKWRYIKIPICKICHEIETDNPKRICRKCDYKIGDLEN